MITTRSRGCIFALLIWLGPLAAQAATDLNFTVNTNEPVTVSTAGGTPRLQLDIGGQTKYATYVSGSGSAALTFTYATQAGDLDLDGIGITSPLQLNGGTITDTVGNALTTGFTLPTTSGVLVNYPSLSMDFLANDYILNGTHYASLGAFLTAASGSFTRAGNATYFDNTGTMQTAGTNVARFDHDPITHAARGFMVEEQRTNSVRNSTMQGASAGMIVNNGGPGGAAGVRPTNWANRGNLVGGLSAYIAGTGTEYGMAYVDYRLAGTAAGAGDFGLYFDGATNIASSNGQTWTASYYARRISSSGSYVTTNLRLLGRTSGGVGTADFSTVDTALSTTLTRVSSTMTIANAASVFVQAGFSIFHTAGAIDVTIRVYAPQLELGVNPTSFIPTTTTAVTRAVDTLTVPTGSWYNATEGTASYIANSPYMGTALYPAYFSLDNGSAATAMHSFINDPGADEILVQIQNTTSQFSYSSPAYTPGTNFLVSLGYKQDDTRVAINGTLSPLDTAVTLPPVTTMRVGCGRSGCGGVGQQSAKGYMRKVVYYPVRVADSQLQLLTQ